MNFGNGKTITTIAQTDQNTFLNETQEIKTRTEFVRKETVKPRK